MEKTNRVAMHTDKINKIKEKKWNKLDDFIDEIVASCVPAWEKAGVIDKDKKTDKVTKGVVDFKSKVGDYTGKYK